MSLLQEDKEAQALRYQQQVKNMDEAYRIQRAELEAHAQQFVVPPPKPPDDPPGYFSMGGLPPSQPGKPRSVQIKPKPETSYGTLFGSDKPTVARRNHVWPAFAAIMSDLGVFLAFLFGDPAVLVWLTRIELTTISSLSLLMGLMLIIVGVGMLWPS